MNNIKTPLFLHFRRFGALQVIFCSGIICLFLFLGIALARGDEHAVLRSLGKIENLVPGDTFVLDLFEIPIRVVINRAAVNRLGTRTIRGRLDAFPKGSFSLSVTDNQSLGFVRIPENNREYRIRYDPETRSLDAEALNPADKDILRSAPPLVPEKTADPLFFTEEGTPAAHPAPLQYAANMYDQEAVIAVMVVYTPDANAWAEGGGGIENIIAQVMEDTQLALDNSDTETTVALVHAQEVDYRESGSSSRDLRRLQNDSDSYMDDVHVWRNRYGADLVALLSKTDDMGGLSYQLDKVSGDPEYAFSLTRVQQAAASYTFAHELGHNMGMGHHKEQLSETEEEKYGGLFDYSAGWRWWGNDGDLYSTIMTYPQKEYFEDGLESINLPYFSNPQIYYEGKPTGNALDGDNARTLRQVRHVIAAYREDAPEAPAILKFTVQPLSIAIGETITLAWAVGAADEVYIEADAGTDIGYVDRSGERDVAPEEDTTYTLTASNAYGEETESLTVTVDDPERSNGDSGGCFIETLLH